MDRTIRIDVKSSYLKKDGKNGGVVGEGNSKYLRIIFDEGWTGLAKKVTFWNAKGLNPVIRTLTGDLLTNLAESELDYTVPIPPEPLEFEGDMTFVIDGYEDGKRIRSLSDTLVVNYAPMDENAAESVDPTPTQAEQLQQEIDSMMGDFQGLAKTATEAAETAAEATELIEQKANEVINASEEVILKTNEAVSAAESATKSATESATSASQAATSAQIATEAAELAESTIETSELAIHASQIASSKATSARESEKNATNAATSANLNAQTAKRAGENAEKHSTLAKSYAVGGTGTRAGENADNAKYYASIAKAVAGGDFVTEPELDIVNAEIGEVETKTEMLWDAVFRDVTDNPILIDFDDLTDVNNLTGGTWNKPRGRLEV